MVSCLDHLQLLVERQRSIAERLAVLRIILRLVKAVKRFLDDLSDPLRLNARDLIEEPLLLVPVIAFDQKVSGRIDMLSVALRPLK